MTSTANTIVKDAACIEGNAKRTTVMKSTVTKKHESAISELENLTSRINVQIQKSVP
jgi:hypothetical protein